jgi:hypothetical protein
MYAAPIKFPPIPDAEFKLPLLLLPLRLEIYRFFRPRGRIAQKGKRSLCAPRRHTVIELATVAPERIELPVRVTSISASELRRSSCSLYAAPLCSKHLDSLMCGIVPKNC